MRRSILLDYNDCLNSPLAIVAMVKHDKHEDINVLMNITLDHTCPADPGKLARRSAVKRIILLAYKKCLNLTVAIVAIVKHKDNQVLMNMISGKNCPLDPGELAHRTEVREQFFMYTQYLITIATFGCGHCETGVKPRYVSFLKPFYYSTTLCIH